MDGGRTQTRIEVLVWNDLVQHSMDVSIATTYSALLKTAWLYLSTGTLRRLSWLAKGPVLAALYPVAMLLGQVLLSILVGSFLGGLVSDLIVQGIAAIERIDLRLAVDGLIE